MDSYLSIGVVLHNNNNKSSRRKRRRRSDSLCDNCSTVMLTEILVIAGLADPQALPLAVSTFQACHFIGKAECPVGNCAVHFYLPP